jgi:hypothetical protein
MCKLHGDSWEDARDEVRRKFIPTYIADLAIWPLAQVLCGLWCLVSCSRLLQAIGFRYIPARFRVVYVSFLTLAWNTFLSFMKHDY